jgi:hypothetical protein
MSRAFMLSFVAIEGKGAEIFKNMCVGIEGYAQ